MQVHKKKVLGRTARNEERRIAYYETTEAIPSERFLVETCRSCIETARRKIKIETVCTRVVQAEVQQFDEVM